MFDNVSGLRRGRHKAEIVSAETPCTRTIRLMCHMPGSSFGIGQPTLAESEPQIVECIRRIGLLCGLLDDVNGRRSARQEAEIVSAETPDTSTIRLMYHLPGSSFGIGQPTLAEIGLTLSNACDL